MTSDLSAPPVLSTPAEHTFIQDSTPSSVIPQAKRPPRPDHELYEIYEIVRTATEIRQNGWRRIALQFPDAMLPDSPWIVNALGEELDKELKVSQEQRQRLYILADTSYSACCVDEIAAEHADADGVVHYGRACLSPTSRLPVLHIFTRQKLDYEAVVETFEKEFQEKTEKAIIMADVTFQEHVVPICELLRERGYTSVVATEIMRDPTGTIPNRKLVLSDNPADHNVKEYHLFHISNPPTSLLLTLSSRFASLRIYSSPPSPYTATSTLPDPHTTPALLRRRYALVVRLATASILGILVNTLSVKNYMSTISMLKSQIAAAGKKSYTIVVGKLNAAKLANFAEVDGWVVVGCWESGLVENESLWKPVITPFELGLALQGEESRVWTGEWWGGIEGVQAPPGTEKSGDSDPTRGQENKTELTTEYVDGGIDDDESEPPEFDLRTGKLVSHSRPMRLAIRNAPRSGPEINDVDFGPNPASSAVVKRITGDVALVNGVASPGAEFLKSQRTWQGLGTDFSTEDENDESTIVEEGRSGVARGYTVGKDHYRT